MNYLFNNSFIMCPLTPCVHLVSIYTTGHINIGQACIWGVVSRCPVVLYKKLIKIILLAKGEREGGEEGIQLRVYSIGKTTGHLDTSYVIHAKSKTYSKNPNWTPNDKNKRNSLKNKVSNYKRCNWTHLICNWTHLLNTIPNHNPKFI